MASRVIVVKIQMEGVSEAERAFNATTKATRSQEQATKAANVEWLRAAKNANDLANANKKLDASLNSKAMKDASIATRALANEQRAAEKHTLALANSQKRLENSQARMSQVQDGLTNSFIKGNLAARGISIGYNLITDALKFGIGEAIKYEFTMAKIQAIAGVTGTELTTLSDKIREVATNSLSTSSEVAEAALEMTKMGVSAKDVGNALGGIVGLATAADESVKATGETVIQVANVFDIASKDINRLTDQIFTGIAQSALSLESFRTAFGYAGATAAEAGVSIEQLTGMMGVLSNRGLRASTIGTGLRKVLTELSDPASKAGMAIGGATIESIGLENVLARLKTVVTDVTISKALFGRTAQNVGLMLANEGDAILKLTGDVDNLKNKADEASPILADAMGGAVKQLTTNFGDLSIELGKTFSPAIIAILGGFTQNIKDFTEGITILKEKYSEFIDYVFKTKNGKYGNTNPGGYKIISAEEYGRQEYDKKVQDTLKASAGRIKEKEKMKQDAEAKKPWSPKTKTSAGKSQKPSFPEDEAAIFATKGLLLDNQKEINAQEKIVKDLKKAEAELQRYNAAWVDLNGTMLENNTITDEWRLNTTLGIETQAIAINALNGTIDAFSNKMAENIVRLQLSFEGLAETVGNVMKQMIADFIAATIRMLIFKAIVGIASGGFGSAATSAVGGAGAGDLAGVGMNFAAKGFSGRVNRPTMFMAGESGAEDVIVKPRSKTAMGNNSGGGLTVNINGDVYDSKAKFTEAVRQAQYSLNKNYV